MNIKVNGKDENVNISSGGCLAAGLGCSFIFWLPVIFLIILIFIFKLIFK